MCGIIGYNGKDNAIPIVINGLKSLEYRGYDSSGIAYFLNDKIYLGIKVNLIIAKLLTEIIIFIFSFIVQKIIIFSKKEQKWKK